MNRKKDSRIKGFDQLKSLDLSFLVVEQDIATDEFIPLNADEGTPLNAESPISDEGTMPTNQYLVKLLDKCSSFTNKDARFSNKLPNLSTNSPLNSKIIEILEMDDMVVDTNDFTLKSDNFLDIGNSKSGNRVRKILSDKGIPIIQYSKWTYNLPEEMQTGKKETGNLLRVISDKNTTTNIFTIVLIDPHHLFATTKTNKYNTVRSYGSCISELIKK